MYVLTKQLPLMKISHFNAVRSIIEIAQTVTLQSGLLTGDPLLPANRQEDCTVLL